MPACTCGKIGYESKAAAKRALRSCRRAAANGDVNRDERRVYRCRARVWHLTSTPHWLWDADELSEGVARG